MINNYKTENGYIKRNAPLMLKVSQPFVGKGFASHWNQVSRETFPIGRLTNNTLLLALPSIDFAQLLPHLQCECYSPTKKNLAYLSYNQTD
ncbi:hypothetical protein BH18ACI1_BH18ACI1_12500 [soil metagenome]